MQNFNYHTHTRFSDGSDMPEVYIEKAIELGLESIGFSDHAPIKGYPTNWNMKLEDLEVYFIKLNQLKEKYKDQIEVLIGLEIDYIPNLISPKSDYLQNSSLDYVIGSVHFLGQFTDGKYWDFEGSRKDVEKALIEIFDNDIEKMVRKYYQHIREMVQLSKPTIIGHLDRIKVINRHKVYFIEKEIWYQEEIEKTLAVIAKTACVLELNTKGMYHKGDTEPYPSNWIVEKALEKNIPIHFAADAHHPKYLTQNFDTLDVIVKKMGFNGSVSKLVLNYF